ncbi:MAG: hypothetical protein LLF94_09970, partial [Chlamydiales bacterium]|nr:hypothetical protein [Chlamydiales bacterium]
MERYTVKGLACIDFMGCENDLNTVNTFLESCYFMTQDLIGIYERACETGKIDIIRRMLEFPEVCQHIELYCEKVFNDDFLYRVSVRAFEYLLTMPAYQKFLYRGMRCHEDDVLSPYRSGEMLEFLAKTHIVQGCLRNLEGFNLQHTELNPWPQKDIQVVHTDGNFIFNLLSLDVLKIVASSLSKRDIVALRGTCQVLREKVDHPKIDVLALQNCALWQERLNRLHMMDNTIPTIIPQDQNPKIWILKTFVDGCEKIFEKHRTLFQNIRHKLDKKEPLKGQSLPFGSALYDSKKYQKNRYICLIRPYKSPQDLEIQSRFL